LVLDDPPGLSDEELRPANAADQFEELAKNEPVTAYDAEARKPLLIPVECPRDEFDRVDERMKGASHFHRAIAGNRVEHADNFKQHIPVLLAHEQTFRLQFKKTVGELQSWLERDAAPAVLRCERVARGSADLA
jgi:hypothetical protein